MQLLKSTLLGAAAGVAAISGVQAADLPVKAKPVEYVKICSAYGAGFYYIPGTDICLRVGGYVRADYYHQGTAGNPSISTSNSGLNNRDEDTHAFRGRGAYILDARQNTSYGTLRAFLNGYVSWTTGATGPANSASANRAFIQFAGFTFGRATSFFDFFGSSSWANIETWNSQITGSDGWNVLAYTAQLGNGVTATFGIEDSRKKAVLNALAISPSTAFATPGGATSSRAGQNIPAIVGNIRVDQSWGSAQVMGALQEIRGQYLGATSAFPSTDNEWGYAFGGGFTWKNPSAPGSEFGIQAAWSKGATGYVAHLYNNHSIYANNLSSSQGELFDAVYGLGPDPRQLQLTEAWGFNAGYLHRFNPQWAMVVHGGYTSIDYNSTVTLAACGPGIFFGCDLDYSFWSLGGQIRWTPVSGLNIGLDLLYNRFETQMFGSGIAASGTRPASLATGDQEVWAAMLRVQRDF